MNVKKEGKKFVIPVFFDPSVLLALTNKSLQTLFTSEVSLKAICFQSLDICGQYPEAFEMRDELNATGMVMMGNILVPIGGLGLTNYIRALKDAGAEMAVKSQRATEVVVAGT